MAPNSTILQDLRRIVNGVSLIAIEAAKRSKTIETAKNGDAQTLISKTLKNAVVAATDLVGLTKGTVREINDTQNPNRRSSSVVYFEDDPKPLKDPSKQTLDGEELVKVSVLLDSEENEKASNGFDKMSPSSPPMLSVAADEALKASGRNIGGETEVIGESEKVYSVSGGPPREMEEVAADLQNNGSASAVGASTVLKKRRPRERKVPATPFTRALGFAGLGVGLVWGTIQESTKRIVYGMPETADKQSALSPFLSEQNAERLALSLCRMRGAALKLGQMLSIQDETLVPAPILAALDIVRQGADVMPRKQLNDVLNAELGPDWSSKLKSFDYEPLAAASIGQVHRAVLKNDMVVAMKIQYPGVADSIDSDIDNVRRLLDYTNLIPKGLFLDRAIKVAKEELSRECDYILEAANQKKYRQFLQNSEGFYVPIVIDEMSSKKVLMTELVAGVPIDKVALLSQKTRDYVGRKLLELTLKELFVFRFMQTDPNWSNFLFDDATEMINLIDFGAAREYSKHFVDDYLRMVIACSNNDRDGVIEMSRRLGFLTGEESEVMLDAHVQAGFVVGLPFSKPGGYDFRATNITRSVSDLGATMLKHRLTPPPDEVYSLHRKLSGSFLACMKLGAVVPCREILLQVYQQYQFDDNDLEFVSTGI